MKKTGVAILFEDSVNFKAKMIKTDREGDYICIRRKTQEEKLTIINI